MNRKMLNISPSILNENKFFFKWVLPLAFPVFFYFTIGAFMDSNLDKEDLIEVKGEISKLEYFESLSRIGTNKNLRIHLKNGRNYEITNDWDYKFHVIEQEKINSVAVTLFHRNSRQTWWRLGTSNQIYHLEIGEKTIIDIEERQSKSKILSLFCGFISFILCVVIFSVRAVKQ